MRKTIRIDRLLAAYEVGHFESWTLFAKKVGVANTTLSRLLKRRDRQVNERTLGRMAEVLRVPADWLAGERENLPYVQEFESPQKPGSQEAHSLWERPTTDHLRWSWLMRRIEVAVRRDLAHWFGDEAQDVYNSWGKPLLWVFAEMARSFGWRLAVQCPARKGSWLELWKAANAPTLDWLEHILDPWLEGHAYLNSGVIAALFRALLKNKKRFWASRVRDSDALRVLEEYERTCENAQGRLAGDLGPADLETVSLSSKRRHPTRRAEPRRPSRRGKR